MAHHQIRIVKSFDKPVADIYESLSDHNNLRKVFGVPVSRIKDGSDSVNGVGSVRRIGPPPVGVQETVVAAELNRSIDYKITRFGGPVMNHHGRMDFSENAGGSEVVWTIDFDSLPIVGPVLETVLTQGIRRGLSKI